MGRREFEKEKNNLVNIRSRKDPAGVSMPLICERVRHYRMLRKMEQKQLATELNITANAVSNWEAGHREPDVSMIGRIARSLGVDVTELLDDSDYEDEAPSPVVIVVEDEPILLTGFIHILENTLPDIQAFGFVSAEEAGVFAAGTRVDIAFLDIELCDESGIDLAKELSALNPHTNIVFLTGHSEYAGDALSMHVSGYILKPLTPDKVREEIRHLRYPVKGLS